MSQFNELKNLIQDSIKELRQDKLQFNPS